MDNIWASRFFNNSRVPAWHKWGINREEDMNANQALELVGSYDVSLQPVMAQHPANVGELIETNYFSVVRHPVPDDDQYRVFGSPVSKGYHLITPRRTAQLADEGLGNLGGILPFPVETFGVLGKGEEIFITFALRSWDLKGDEMQNFLYCYFPMYNGKAAVVGITTIRIVCANTLNAALRNSQRQFKITHTASCETAILNNLIDLTGEADNYQDALQDTMGLMANATISDVDAKSALAYIYRDPPKPDDDWAGKFGHAKTLDEYMENYELKIEQIGKVRDTVFGLYSGETFANGSGTKHSASTIDGFASVQGTPFGLYNSVSEYESHRRGNAHHATIGLMTGDRGLAIRRAFEASLHYSKTGDVLQYFPN